MRKRVLIAAAVVALFAASCSGGAKSKNVAASPDSMAVEASTKIPPTASSSGRLPLRAAPDAFVRKSYAPGQAIEEKSGVFFMDARTGAVEGWRLSDAVVLGDGDDPANCCYFGTVSDDNRFVLFSTSKTSWLSDRKIGKGVSWAREDLAFVASSSHYLIFARAANPGSDPNPELDGRYTVVDQNFATVSSFKLERAGRGLPPVLFSPDGRTLVIPAGNQSWSDYTNLQQVDLGTGTVHRLATLPVAPPGFTAGQPAFSALAGGNEFAVAIASQPRFDAEQSAQGTLAYRTLVRRYSWSGQLLAEFEVPSAGASLSPDGKLLAYEQIRRFVSGGADGPAEYWSNVVVADGHTGAPLLRVRSASLYYGDGLGSAKWLADSSGIPVAVRPPSARTADVPAWRHRSFALLLPNEGRIEPLTLAEDDLLAPIPAPDRPGLFAIGHTAAMELSAGRRVTANVPGEVYFGHIPPWGNSSAELRFALPHGGHGAGYRGAFLPPRVEYPPFDNRLEMRVTGTGSCLNLRASPSLTAATSVCVADEQSVTLSDPAVGPPYGALAAWWADETFWLYIRTRNGDEGWASSEFLAWR